MGLCFVVLVSFLYLWFTVTAGWSTELICVYPADLVLGSSGLVRGIIVGYSYCLGRSILYPLISQTSSSFPSLEI
jgi:hypothetical protein